MFHAYWEKIVSLLHYKQRNMAGLYIHIPFCARRCLYCDFFTQTDQTQQTAYVDTLIREMEMEAAYLNGQPLQTIYFGGGTPSQLPPADFERIFQAVERCFGLSSCREITLEANPDDLTPDYVRALHDLPFNRISMGIQSFDAADLSFLHRRHTARQAIDAVDLCKSNGLTNISIDLMYGLPGQTPEKWACNLEKALALDVPHISAYHLIYEEGTGLYRLLQSGQITPVEEEVSVALFASLIDHLSGAGYEHYEISNFARPGYMARHNSSYWDGAHYLGLGASAHSYNGTERKWNVASLPTYLQGIADGKPAIEREQLDIRTSYNDYVITRLRTRWGIDPGEINRLFGEKCFTYFLKQIKLYVKKGLLEQENDHIRLSRDGIFISDGIMSALMMI